MIDSTLVDRLLSGEKSAVARGITLIESQSDESLGLLNSIHKRLGHAYRVGITGPPGAGKSTLAGRLARSLSDSGKKIGIIAVDPTSPFSGGALLGDRVRMMDLSSHSGVFIRSMATRGSLGGLSKTAQQAADVLDAAGFDYVFLETVGVGQSELDVVEAADTTVVVLTPESGDSVQAMKAGLMEIADFFVLNKADRPGVDQSYSAISTVLQISGESRKTGTETNGWVPFIVKTVASENRGIGDVIKGIDRHYSYLVNSKRLFSKRKERLRRVVIEIIEEQLHEQFWTKDRISELEVKLDLVLSNELSTVELARELTKK